MYQYSLKGKIISVLSVVILIALFFIVKHIVFKTLFMLFALLMVKDAISVMTFSYHVTDQGLYRQDVFGKRQVCNWHDLEYITITKKNKKWIALVSNDRIKYIKDHILNRDMLLKEMIGYAKKNKELAIHDTINEVYQLGLNLNDQGKIRAK